MSLPKSEGDGTIQEIVDAMVAKHIPYIEDAGKQGVQILCLQEIFNTPYFCPGQDKNWYGSAETVPGPTVELMQEYAQKYNMVMIVPIYEKEQAGVLYNTAAVIDADGKYMGKYRKNHIPHTSGFWEKFFFKPGNLGYPVFQTQYAKVGVYICYDRHFPDGAVEWIEQLRLNHHRMTVGKNVIVLGGGNTAMDAASESARLGAESVTLAYRRSKEEMGAYSFEYELAKEVGVKGLFNVSPLEILGDHTVTGVKFINTIVIDGKVQNVPGSEFVMQCDRVIKATGQSKQKHLLELIGGIQTKPDGTITINQSYQTTNPKYFAAGDAVSGGQEVVNAVADGKKAAREIVSYLNR